jgi:hypothetical protein
MSQSAGSGSQAARTLSSLYSTFDRAQSGSQALAKMHQRNAAYQRGRCVLEADDVVDDAQRDSSPARPVVSSSSSSSAQPPRRPSPSRSPTASPTTDGSLPADLTDEEMMQAAFQQLCEQIPPAKATVSSHTAALNPLHSMDPLHILQWTWARSMETPQKRHRFLTALKRSAGCSDERAVEDVQRLDTLVMDFERGLLQWNVLGGVGSLVEDGLMKSFSEVLSGEGEWSPKAEAVWRAALVHFKEPPLRYC